MPVTPRSTVRIELIARLAWLTAFVLPLLLAVVLLGARGAGATPADPPPGPIQAAEFEGEEEGIGFCDMAKAEFEEGWLSEAEMNEACSQEEAELAAPEAQRERAEAECPLRSASGHATTSKRKKLRVTVGYTTNFPVQATIQLFAGQARVATYKRQLGRSGVLRFSKQLGENLLAKRPSVRLKLPKSGGECPSRRLVLFPR